MTENKLTWTEFAEKYKPKQGDKFLDDRGNEWIFGVSSFGNKDGAIVSIGWGNSGFVLTCPLIPPKQKRKMWPAFSYSMSRTTVGLSWLLYENEADARQDLKRDFHSWPAIPNSDGSYSIED